MTRDALPIPPGWLAPLQEAFGRMLRTPLDASTGTFRSALAPAQLAPDLAGPAAGPVLYHEQYWMRLFGAMQSELPRVADVIGPWRFNTLAALHLDETPPVHADLGRCADGFARRVRGVLDGLAGSGATPDTRPVGALVAAGSPDPWVRALAGVSAPVDLARQALRIDEAARLAFVSPAEPAWRPTPADLEGLMERRLRFARSFRLLREDWALVERAGPRPFARHHPAWFWVSCRTPRSTAFRRLEPAFAHLLEGARLRPLGEALAAVEEVCPPAQADALRRAIRKWIGVALESGWWVGVEPAR